MAFATGENSLFVCDVCGFTYPYTSRRKSSYGTIQCDDCYDGAYDLKNHPQNFGPPLSEDPQGLEDPRPEEVFETPTSLWTPSTTRAL